MASLSQDRKGLWRLLVCLPDGRRPAIRLGRMPESRAERFKRHVEAIVAAIKTGDQLDDETILWANKLREDIFGSLVKAGLLQPRERPKQEILGEFVDRWVEGRKVDAKASSIRAFGLTRNDLVSYFGKDRPLQSILPGDADDFRRHLLQRKLAMNTVNRRCGFAKQIFKAAVRKGLVTVNPFADHASNVKPNPSRFHFVGAEESKRVLAACPDVQWRMIFALCRWGGLRCPSEVFALRWQDVNWELGRLSVRSPKTAHHAGMESRVVPIFPEIRPHLEEGFELAPPGAEFVIETRYRRENVFLRRQFEAIVLKAGLRFWGKPFQNLRSTRETELVESYPLHVVTSWLGNSPTIASKHYLQTTEAHFEQAIGESAQFAAHSEESTSDTEETALKLEAEKRGNAAQCSLVEVGSANNPCLVRHRGPSPTVV